MNKKSVYRNQEKTLRNLRWHFAKMKNASAICADILQICFK